MASQTRTEQYDPEQILRTHGRSFHFAKSFLGARHGTRAARLYAFCRYLDDIADESPSREQARSALDRTDQALATATPIDPYTEDFLRLSDELSMDLAPARALITGVRSDLSAVRIKSEAELIQYAYHVAGVVGLMMCSVLDVDDGDAAPHAVDLGIAMQLTNIARDVGEDASLGRRYLPASWVGDLMPDALIRPDPATSETLRTAVARLLDRAEEFYHSAEAGMAYLPFRARLGILVAARTYRRIGREIARMNYQTWTARAHVSGLGKAGVAGRAFLALATQRRFFRLGNGHRAELHSPIAHLPIRFSRPYPEAG